MTSVIGPDGHPHHVYTISGVRVEFPAKAYPSQIAMMDKVIRGLQRGQHCLLESPTGSGKTLALLCASLAWQKAEAENVRKHNETVEMAARAALKEEIYRAASLPQEKPPSINPELVKQEIIGHHQDPSDHLSEDEEEDDDFQPTKRKKMSPRVKPVEKSEASVVTPQPQPPPLEPETPMIPQKQRIPKIFFGTRTHKQIAQVVKEFRRTTYCKTPMTVLASREHTCIHPEVSKSSNKNEGCRTLNDPRKLREQKGGGCSYRPNQKLKLKNQAQVKGYGLDSGWDIEDLVKLGRRMRICPYYSTRDLMDQAQIIFSPYNYLIDPRVRQSMKIPLNNNIIILDEAHNIEDSAREAAGGSFSKEEFHQALLDCEKVGPKNETLGAEIEKLGRFASFMMNWIDKRAASLVSVGIDRDVHIMSGTEFVASLSLEGYGDETLKALKAVVDYVFEVMEGENENFGEASDEPKLTLATRTILDGFLMIMELMLSENQVHRDDYKAVVVRTVERRSNKVFKQAFSSQLNYSLNLWCLNPAVVLKEVRESTKSIIVTSGTLSPMSSYKSELDIDFKIQLEANHVIPPNRVWIGSISQGPTNVLLNGTFRSTSSYDYQDELGRLVLNMCKTVPHGVLCFLPSYTLLEKLTERWESIGIWAEMAKYKSLVCESRDSNAFEETLKTFYGAIQDSERELDCDMDSSGEMADYQYPNAQISGVSGALMLAVCRGKVSEGLDFTDNNARAVICVGIPFPNFKDTQVELKRTYNDARSATSDHLKGSDWYEIQAFRALNQALGRCIRHKADWGAILLVDDRFAKIPRYVNQLSKWVRSSIRHFHAFDPMMQSLKGFTENFVAEDAANLLAVKQEQTQSMVASPYFKEEKVATIKPEPVPMEVIELSDDEDDPALPPPSFAQIRVKNENIPSQIQPSFESLGFINGMQPLAPKVTQKSSILGSSNKLSLSQQRRAAEHGSRYFVSVADPSGAIQSKFIP